MKKFLVFFVIMSFFSSSRPAASYAAQNHGLMLRELKSLTQPARSSDLPFSPSNAHYSANGQLLEIDPATIVLARETYWTPDFTLIPITALRTPESLTLINHSKNPAAETTATHFNWTIDPETFSNHFHRPSVALHPHQLRVAFTHDQRKIIFINFTRNNFSVRENLSIHTIACHEGVGPEILFGPNDLFATQLHGQVCIYNLNYPDGTIITEAFAPFNRPLEDTSAETLTLDRQLHEQCTDICSMKFNPDPNNEQLVVHRNNELSIVNPRTTEVQIKIKNTQPISSFTRRGNCLAYLNNNGEVVTLDTESLEPHKLITLLKPILQMSFCPFSNPLLMIFCGNHDKKTITVYDIYQGKMLEKKGPHFEKVTWVPNTTTISAFTSSEEGNSSLTQWNLDQASETYLYAREDHGEFNLDKTHFFDSLIWQVNNNQILELQNGQDLYQIFSQFPDNVQDELVATGKILFTEPNLLPEDQDEPNYGETPPPAYDDIFLDPVVSENNASITDPVVANPQQRHSLFQRFLAFIHLRRLQNHH